MLSANNATSRAEGSLIMNNLTLRKIHTGSDPRRLPDYAALRDELSKLTHPARPDVNWQYVEKRCLSLFEQNGVELQTAAWYTLARTQLAGLTGLNEGLAILEALISHQWASLWPQPVHARMEILSSLFQRLHQGIRSLTLNDSDFSQLYRAEQRVIALGEVLQRQELKPLSQLETLRILLHNSAIRLKNSEDIPHSRATVQPEIVLSAVTMNDETVSASMGDITVEPSEAIPLAGNTVKWVYVAQPQRQPNVDTQAAVSTTLKKWTFFAAGMFTMLVITTAATWGWKFIHRQDPLQIQLAASLAPLPVILTSEQLAVLRLQTPLPYDLITQTQQQLVRMNSLPPDWNIDFSRKLIEQLQALYPEQAKPLMQQWQQQLQVLALSTDALNGWHRGMVQLQVLADKLDALDGQKGKYLTVSELKSQVFGMMTSFRQTVPVEEKFRLLNQLPNDSLQRQQQVRQVEQHLRAQIFRLAQENSVTKSRGGLEE